MATIYSQALQAQQPVHNSAEASSFTGDWFTRTFDPLGAEQAFNANQAALERAFNASEAQKQRDFEERMSSTAYSRAVQDLRNAGLNPYAIYGGYSPSSTPAGTSAYSTSARSGSGRPGLLSQVVNTAFDLARLFITASS